MVSRPNALSVPRLWRNDDRASRGADAGTRRRRTAFALQAAIMATVGAIVGMFLWISPAPRPRLVAFWVARPPSGRLPSPPMAAPDLANLGGRWYFPGIGA